MEKISKPSADQDTQLCQPSNSPHRLYVGWHPLTTNQAHALSPPSEPRTNILDLPVRLFNIQFYIHGAIEGQYDA